MTTTIMPMRPSEMNDTEKFFTVLAMTHHKNYEFCVPVEKAMEFLKLEPEKKPHIVRIIKAQFEEGTDFIRKQLPSTGGRPEFEYFLSVPCFKEFCMVSKSEIGRQVRQYYLRLEDMLFNDITISEPGLSKILAMLLAVELGNAKVCQVYPLIEEKMMRHMDEKEIALAFQNAKGYNLQNGGHDA